MNYIWCCPLTHREYLVKIQFVHSLINLLRFVCVCFCDCWKCELYITCFLFESFWILCFFAECSQKYMKTFARPRIFDSADLMHATIICRGRHNLNANEHNNRETRHTRINTYLWRNFSSFFFSLVRKIANDILLMFCVERSASGINK